MTTTASVAAAARYNERTAEIRRTMDRSTREFAAAMSAASAEYEAAMAAAAAGGDKRAKRCLKASRE